VLEDSPASATVLAVTPCTLRELNPAAIADPLVREPFTVNLARTLAARLRQSTEEILVRHEQQAATLRLQGSASVFVTQILICLSGYILGLPLFALLRDHVLTESLISFFIIAVLTWVAWSFLTRSSTGLEDYGVTWRDWPQQLLRSFWFSLPLIVLATALKAVAVWRTPQAVSWFEPWRVFGRPENFHLGAWTVFAATYFGMSFAQELVRCAIQGSLAIYYRASGQTDQWRSVLVANLVFAATHVHLGLMFPLIASVPGLFWGWMYHRHRSYLGLGFSHALIGSWAFFALGIAL